jgi:protein phosphatase
MNEERQVRWSGLTDKGPFRKNNEDAFLALTFDRNEVRLLGKEGVARLSEGDFIFAVSDGMGGANAGEFASRTAVRRITETFPRQFRSGGKTTPEGGMQMLQRLFLQIHEAVLEMSRFYEECSGMGATLSLLWLTPCRYIIGHVGDSRIYRLDAQDQLEQLTHDQTHAGWLFREGKINEREARNHPERHKLHCVIGGKQKQFEPQFISGELCRGDRFVLCTDGLTDGLWDNTIHSLLVRPVPRLQQVVPAKRLVDEALFVSGRDNTTAMVVELDG